MVHITETENRSLESCNTYTVNVNTYIFELKKVLAYVCKSTNNSGKLQENRFILSKDFK